MLVSGLMANSRGVNLGVHRDSGKVNSKLVIDRHDASKEWAITAHEGVQGFEDLAAGESFVTDQSRYLEMLEALIP